MRHRLINTIYDRGIYAANAVPVAQVLETMALLHPQITEHELIRIGGDGDGGYLVPDDLRGISRCFSPGVSDVATFEEELAACDIRSYLSDYSVEKPPVENPLFHFEKKFLGSMNSEMFTTLNDWVGRHAPDDDHDMILQIDIEGWEYETLLAAPSDLLGRFRIIVIELHHLRDLMTPFGNQIIGSAFRKLVQDHVVVHSHPNNWFPSFRYQGAEFPSALEVTLIRKDRVRQTAPATQFPHPLDRACAPDRPDQILPASWRAHG